MWPVSSTLRNIKLRSIRKVFKTLLPPNTQTHITTFLHPSFPLLLLVHWMHKRHAYMQSSPARQHCVCCCLWILSKHCCTHLHKRSEGQVISKHIHVGFETAWLLLALIECMKTESDFPVLSKSAVCKVFSLAWLAWAMATVCHRPKKGQHSSRAVAVNIHSSSLKQDPQK